jgi:hypothetical protein
VRCCLAAAAMLPQSFSLAAWSAILLSSRKREPRLVVGVVFQAGNPSFFVLKSSSWGLLTHSESYCCYLAN